MKICFLLQRRFAFVGHKIAKILQTKYGVNEFCGYVYTQTSFDFLQRQTDIVYTSLILDEAIHEQYRDEPLDLNYLAWLEKEYGLPNLWPYLTIDRVVMYNQLVREYPYHTPPYTHEEMMRILQVKAKTIINFLETEQPDILVITVVGGIGSMLLYQIAKKKGIKILLITLTRLGDGYTITNDYKKFSYAEQCFDNLMALGIDSPQRSQARHYLTATRDRHTNYLHYSLDDANKNYRLRPLKWLAPAALWRSLAWFAKLCYRYAVGRQRSYCDHTPLGYLIDRLKRKTRTTIGFNRWYDPADFKENFAFFPLHYEPEIATLLFAPFWSDQLNLVRQIAKSLPLSYKLYVKEHPAMIGYRTHAYYRELKNIPNVKLIAHNVNSFEIIKYAKLVAVISGTVGWEAAVMRKPVITFGDVFYNKLSTVVKCDTIEQLPLIVKRQLEQFNYSEAELENFIGAIMEESADAGMMEIWEKGLDSKTEEVRRLTLLADLLANKMNLQPILQ